jgi:Family of unknown function (DUF5681)
MSETTGRQQPRRWKKGESGNPAGRPKGARHKATLAAEQLLDGEAEALTRKAIEKAKEGDSVALRLCLDRILPPRKDRPLRINLPRLAAASDATTALATITAAVATGEITPGEGADLNAIVGGFVKAVETSDIEARVAALERKASDGKQV